MAYNEPKFRILLAVVASALSGGMMPGVGIVLSKLLKYMTASWVLLEYYVFVEEYDGEGGGRGYLETKVKFYAALMGFAALCCGIFKYNQRNSFGILGENVTYRVRQ